MPEVIPNPVIAENNAREEGRQETKHPPLDPKTADLLRSICNILRKNAAWLDTPEGREWLVKDTLPTASPPAYLDAGYPGADGAVERRPSRRNPDGGHVYNGEWEWVSTSRSSERPRTRRYIQNPGSRSTESVYESNCRNCGLLTYPPLNQWIALSDRFPSQEDASPEGCVFVHFRYGGSAFHSWSSVASRTTHDVDYWMPVPALPGTNIQSRNADIRGSGSTGAPGAPGHRGCSGNAVGPTGCV